MNAVSAFRRLVQRASPGQVPLVLVLMILAGLSEGFGVLVLVPLLQLLQGGAGHPAETSGWLMWGARHLGVPLSAGAVLIAFCGLMILRNAVQYARERCSASLQFGVVERLRAEAFAALVSAEWRWLLGRRQSDHVSILLTDIQRVGGGFGFALALLASSVTSTAYLLAAVVLSWRLTLVAAVSGLVVLALLAKLRRRAIVLGESLSSANRSMQAAVQESLAGMKLAKVLGRQGHQLDVFVRSAGAIRHQQLAFAASNSFAKAAFQTLGASLLALYLYAGLMVWHAPLARMLVLVLIFARMVPIFVSAQQQLYYWLHAVPAFAGAQNLLDEAAAHADPAQSGTEGAWAVAGDISLHDVTVRFPGRDAPALAEVSLVLRAGTTTVVMGASGAGKSTLADVLNGLLTPDAGCLRVDGIAVTAERRGAWRRAVAYVPQDGFLIHDSIRNNLAWACPQAGEQEILQALRDAAADFVFELPHGLDTVVGDQGLRLSGGERQRLALARALLQRPQLLILDESTSALDNENEARVMAAVERLHGRMVVLVISHRPTSLASVDQTVVLDRGRRVNVPAGVSSPGTGR